MTRTANAGGHYSTLRRSGSVGTAAHRGIGGRGGRRRVARDATALRGLHVGARCGIHTTVAEDALGARWRRSFIPPHIDGIRRKTLHIRRSGTAGCLLRSWLFRCRVITWLGRP